MTALVLVFMGGCVGAETRYLTDRFVGLWHASAFPWGTLTVNVVGSAILGLVAGWWPGSSGTSDAALLIGTGFCGALTTFSTFSFETFRLAEERQLRTALTYVGVSLVAGVAAASLGYGLAIAA